MKGFRIVRCWFRGRQKRYWVQIYLTGNLGFGKFWYYLDDVTPYGYGVNGFKTKAEAEALMKSVEELFNGAID